MGKTSIYAIGVHTGGGKILLIDLLEQAPEASIDTLYLDHRLKLDPILESKFKVIRSNSGFFKQRKLQKLLQAKHSETDHVLFFSNLPPMYKLNCKASVFMQNQLIMTGSSPKMIFLRGLLNIYSKHADEYIVQTQNMKNKLLKFTKRPIQISPFAPVLSTQINYNLKRKRFVYISSLELHKNHKNLIDAWIQLAEKSIYPELLLIISGENTNSFTNELDQTIKEYKLNIDYKVNLKREECLRHLQLSTYLIYPSKNESYGLPLIEAQQCGTHIVASDLDYVYDVCKPIKTFNPKSPKSIAQSVKAVINQNLVAPDKYKTPTSFDFLEKHQFINTKLDHKAS